MNKEGEIPLWSWNASEGNRDVEKRLLFHVLMMTCLLFCFPFFFFEKRFIIQAPREQPKEDYEVAQLKRQLENLKAETGLFFFSSCVSCFASFPLFSFLPKLDLDPKYRNPTMDQQQQELADLKRQLGSFPRLFHLSFPGFWRRNGLNSLFISVVSWKRKSKCKLFKPLPKFPFKFLVFDVSRWLAVISLALFLIFFFCLFPFLPFCSRDKNSISL